jgi:hypothetical protein
LDDNICRKSWTVIASKSEGFDFAALDENCIYMGGIFEERGLGARLIIEEYNYASFESGVSGPPPSSPF